jgi:hypothetical protein
MTLKIEPQRSAHKTYPWKNEEWIEGAVKNPSRIKEALSDLGVDAKAVTKDLDTLLGDLVRRFPEDFAPFGRHDPPRPQARDAWKQTIWHWIIGLRVVEEDSRVETREVPLCVFDSPLHTNAKTTYAESRTGGGTVGWSIEVLGSGFGSDSTVTVTQSSQFVSTEGDRKLVFAPLQIRLVKAALYRRGDLQSRFLRAELAESTVRDANGIRSVGESEWRHLVDGGRVVERFDLSGDKSNDVATYKRSYSLASKFEAKLGFKAFDLESSVTTKCSAEQTVEMALVLPAGDIYELKTPPKIAGFHFQS